jgi:hypothetical protein
VYICDHDSKEEKRPNQKETISEEIIAKKSPKHIKDIKQHIQKAI